MSTETNNFEGFRLEQFSDQVAREKFLTDLEAGELHFVKLEARPKDLGSLGTVLCALRARNVAALVQLVAEVPPQDELEAASAISTLHEWDQLSLASLVTLCEQWLPESIAKLLHAEAKIEQMWFREWLGAVEDPRIDKIPGLPWRRFIRKIVRENFEFADQLLQLSLSDDADKSAKIEKLCANFLAEKKKVVSIFPKKWSKN